MILQVDYKHYKGAPEGNDCWFMESMGRGYKFYDDLKDRDESYSRQLYIASKGLAPEVYWKGAAMFTCSDATGMYFYETEIAETIENTDRPAKDFYRHYDDLESDLRGIGIDYDDWVPENVGLLRGKPVVIDCGYPMVLI